MNILQVYYSENLEDDIDVGSLLSAVHDSVTSAGDLSTSSLKTLALPVQNYLIADCDPENTFLHVVARVKRRDQDVLKRIEETIFNAISDFLEAYFDNRFIELSVEIVAISPLRRGNIQEKIRRETKRRSRASL